MIKPSIPISKMITPKNIWRKPHKRFYYFVVVLIIFNNIFPFSQFSYIIGFFKNLIFFITKLILCFILFFTPIDFLYLGQLHSKNYCQSIYKDYLTLPILTYYHLNILILFHICQLLPL